MRAYETHLNKKAQEVQTDEMSSLTAKSSQTA